jgi:hypothetical protein
MSNELPAKQGKFPLPKLQDLYEQQEIELLSKFNDFNKLLNAPPKKEWLFPHPTATKEIINAQGQKEKVPVEFIPIGIIEYLLTSLFIKWKPEILKSEVMANSIVLTVRVHVLNPISMEWEWADGIGAAPIRTNKGAAATDFSQVQSSAVQTGAPAAKSFAIKDACECFGKIFGKDLNRNIEMDYQPMQEAKFRDMAPKDIPVELAIVISEADAEGLETLINGNPEYHNLPSFKEAVLNRRSLLKKFAL